MPATPGDRAVPGQPPPLALYVHVPWCLRKCPYCDFNSHALRGDLPEAEYVDVLLADLEQDVAALAAPAPLISVFIGGGTPSLLSGAAVARLLAVVRATIGLAAGAEVTLEANPGAAESARFAAYREAGVNRLSIGAQSLSPSHLERLGRIHGPGEVSAAVAAARSAGFDNLNLDLMYALPGQSLDQARRDLEAAIALDPGHLSYYQLTLEPNTAFHADPPPLPDDDLGAEMHEQGLALLAAAGYAQYEVSAHARPGRRCRHNLNYWEFGDYLGIGAGAHGKVTTPSAGPWRVRRTAKLRHPAAYMDPANRGRLVSSERTLGADDLVLELAMNALRLCDGFYPGLFEAHTGLGVTRILPIVDQARADGLLAAEGDRIRASVRGRWYLNDLIARFAPE
ncbi:MAG: radical SAM family heme chaperone HemW [Chromatiaceae bacterium]|nr:radical SAM family heme chaperone HemW [Chromatiaceae bacterium]